VLVVAGPLEVELFEDEVVPAPVVVVTFVEPPEPPSPVSKTTFPPHAAAAIAKRIEAKSRFMARC
jgi:hypothetical protein